MNNTLEEKLVLAAYDTCKSYEISLVCVQLVGGRYILNALPDVALLALTVNVATTDPLPFLTCDCHRTTEAVDGRVTKVVDEVLRVISKSILSPS